jgi:hypothetical protein
MKTFPFLLKAAFLFLLISTPAINDGQDINGKPLPHFLFPSFREGRVLMKDGTSFTTKLNYHMVDEMMITEVDGKYRYSKDPKLIDTIYLENRIFVPVGNKFYEVLAKGPVTIFLQNRSNFTPKGADIGYGAKSKSVGQTSYRRFELVDVIAQYGEVAYMEIPPNSEVTPAPVFWIRKGGSFEKFANEKQFLKFFPGSETKIREYIKKERISMKSPADLAILGKFCNSL